MPWSSERTQFTNCIRNGQTEVWLDRDNPDVLEIMAEQGSGYCREAITTNIPIEYLVQLMEHAGFRVDYPSGPEREALEEGGPRNEDRPPTERGPKGPE